MGDFAKFNEADRCLRILELLLAERDARLNDGLLQKYLEIWGYRVAREVVRSDLNRLADLGAVIVARPMDGLFVAELTRRGQDHVERRTVLEGVAQPALREP